MAMDHNRLTELLACPNCADTDLSFSKKTIQCTKCNKEWPIAQEVINFLPDALSPSEEVSRKTYDTYGVVRDTNTYYWMYKEKRERQIIKSLELLNLTFDELRGKNIIQIGSGEGLQLELFARNGANCIGLDISLNMLKLGVAYSKGFGYARNINFVACSAEKPLPLQCNKFNINMAYSCINHIHPDYWLAYLKERIRITLNSGTIYDVVPNITNKCYRSPVFQKLKRPGEEQQFLDYVTKDKLINLYEKCGLVDIKCYDYDRVLDELKIVSLPELLLKRVLSIKSKRYPNYLYSKIFNIFAWLDDSNIRAPFLLHEIAKWTLISGRKIE